MTAYIPRGVIPANLLPFTPDWKIDAPAYRQHLRDLAAVEGIMAITTNGHAAEVHALSADEQREVLDITLDELGDKLPIISASMRTTLYKAPGWPAWLKAPVPGAC